MSPVPVQVQLRQVQLSAVRSLWQVRLVAGAAHCRCSSLCAAQVYSSSNSQSLACSC